MDGGQRNLGRTVVLGGTILVAVGLISAGFLMPGKPADEAEPDPPVEELVLASLHTYAEEGDLARMQELIDAGADVDEVSTARGTSGLTPLMISVRDGSSEPAALLLSAGANPNLADGAGRTVLFVAAEKNDLDLVELLLEAGADPAATASGGRTPLMSASGSDEPSITILLLNAGANVQARDATGRTAHDLASIRNDTAGREIAAMLAEAGSR